MPVIKLRIFSFVLELGFTRICVMKCKCLTSWVIFGLCVPYVVLASPIEINDVSEFNSLTSLVSDNILLKGAGVYSLSHLRDIAGSGIEIEVWNNSVILSVDDSFRTNNEFDTSLAFKQSSLAKFRLDNSFVEDLGTDGELHDLVKFTSIDYDGEPLVSQQTLSSDYYYYFADCVSGSGVCIHRRYSAAYIAAQNISSGLAGIESIVQYTPSVLLRPVTVINQHELFGNYDFADDYFISVVPEYYNARDFNDMGLRLNIGTKFGGHLFAGLSAYLSTANFKYGVDDFDYAVYGGNLRLLYELNDTMFVRGVGGLSAATIKSSAENNPNIFNSYFGADVGAKFNFESGLYVSPFVGYGMTNAAVLGVHDNVYLGHVGTDVGFKYFMDGVSYSYNLRAGVNTGGYIDASAGIDAWTVSDKIGGGVSIGVVDTEFGWSGKFSANVRFAF